MFHPEEALFLVTVLWHAIKIINSNPFSGDQGAQIPPLFKGGSGGICPKPLK
jgi:hypothetical protein